MWLPALIVLQQVQVRSAALQQRCPTSQHIALKHDEHMHHCKQFMIWGCAIGSSASAAFSSPPISCTKSGVRTYPVLNWDWLYCVDLSCAHQQATQALHCSCHCLCWAQLDKSHVLALSTATASPQSLTEVGAFSAFPSAAFSPVSTCSAGSIQESKSLPAWLLSWYHAGLTPSIPIITISWQLLNQ